MPKFLQSESNLRKMFRSGLAQSMLSAVGRQLSLFRARNVKLRFSTLAIAWSLTWLGAVSCTLSPLEDLPPSFNRPGGEDSGGGPFPNTGTGGTQGSPPGYGGASGHAGEGGGGQTLQQLTGGAGGALDGGGGLGGASNDAGELPGKGSKWGP